MPRNFGRDVRDYVTDYIKFADTKAGAILALVLAVASALGALVDQSFARFGDAFPPVVLLAILFGLAAALATVAAVWHLIAAIGPRTDLAGNSLASFPDIASFTVREYEEAHGKLDDEAIAREFAKLNAQLSRIATAKFASIRTAIWWLRIQLLAGYGLFLFVGVIRILVA